MNKMIGDNMWICPACATSKLLENPKKSLQLAGVFDPVYACACAMCTNSTTDVSCSSEMRKRNVSCNSDGSAQFDRCVFTHGLCMWICLVCSAIIEFKWRTFAKMYFFNNDIGSPSCLKLLCGRRHRAKWNMSTKQSTKISKKTCGLRHRLSVMCLVIARNVRVINNCGKCLRQQTWKKKKSDGKRVIQSWTLILAVSISNIIRMHISVFGWTVLSKLLETTLILDVVINTYYMSNIIRIRTSVFGDVILTQYSSISLQELLIVIPFLSHTPAPASQHPPGPAWLR